MFLVLKECVKRFGELGRATWLVGGQAKTHGQGAHTRSCASARTAEEDSSFHQRAAWSISFPRAPVYALQARDDCAWEAHH